MLSCNLTVYQRKNQEMPKIDPNPVTLFHSPNTRSTGTLILLEQLRASRIGMC